MTTSLGIEFSSYHIGDQIKCPAFLSCNDFLSATAPQIINKPVMLPSAGYSILRRRRFSELAKKLLAKITHICYVYY